MKRTRLRPYVLAICLCAALATALFVRFSHFNPLTGHYWYDPRIEAPSDFFLANRPDYRLVDVLTRQIERDGTYPPGAAVRVGKITPLKVDLGSVYTDWQIYATIDTRLDYVDGTSRVETFRFHSGGTQGLWLPPVGDVAYAAIYGNLTACQPVPEMTQGNSFCGYQ